MKQYFCEICKKQVQGRMICVTEGNHELHFHKDCLLACISKEWVVRVFWPIFDDITVKRFKNDLSI